MHKWHKINLLFVVCFSLLSLWGTFAQAENLLGNPDFSSPLYTTELGMPSGDFMTEDNWLLLEHGGQVGSARQENGFIKMDITHGGTQSWAVQLLQGPITVEQYMEYTVTFDAKAEIPRDIEIKIGATAARGWTPYNPGPGNAGAVVKNISSELETYAFSFTMLQATDELARFEFELGLATGDIWIGNVSMTPMGMVDIDSAADTQERERDWYVFWSDEFDQGSIDAGTWSFEIGNGHANGIPGWGNAELQYYTDSSQNAYVEDDKLVIQVLEEEREDFFGSYAYTSARMISSQKLNMEYGKVEVRAKLPEGQGIWPAIWMLGENIGEVGWPRCGEIDIMELVGHQPHIVHGTVHGPGYSGGGGIGGVYSLADGRTFSDDFHVFSVIWEPDRLEWYVDGERYFTLSREYVETFYGDWVFEGKFFFIFNVAVGGHWPRDPDETTVFPQTMEIDYIRLYKDISQNTVFLDNVGITDLEANEQLIVNGNFQHDLNPWVAWWGDQWVGYAEGDLSVTDQGLQINLDKLGTVPWSPQVMQDDIELRDNTTYKVSFDAMAAFPRKITVQIGKGLDHDPWFVPYMDPYTLELTQEMTTYELSFTKDNPQYSTGKIVFELGPIE